MNTTGQRKGGADRLLAAAFMLFVVAVCSPASVRAQWATPTPGSNDIVNTNSGNVGIGTGTAQPPSEKLQVAGNVAANAFFQASRTTTSAGAPKWVRIATGSGNIAGTFEVRWVSPARHGHVRFVAASNYNTPPHLTVIDASHLSYMSGPTVPLVRVLTGGTYDATYLEIYLDNLDWNGNPIPVEIYQLSGYGWTLLNPQAGSAPSGYTEWSMSTNVVFAAGRRSSEGLFVIDSGNVGVGTPYPQVKLAVGGAGTNVYATDAWVENNLHVQGPEGLVQGGRGRLRVGTAWGYSALYAEGSSTGAGNDLVLGASSGTVRVGPGGGTAQNLVVANGDISASGTITGGNIQAKFQDVAEWVPSIQKLRAGTVVVLDAARANHVVASGRAYDTAVAGVVSDSPGVILGEGGDDKLKVATTGRVKVRVDATRAPIRVGDLLVTSDVEGVAMKSVPVDLGGAQMHRPGTIIGKALEPLEKGTGEILVLLSLQ